MAYKKGSRILGFDPSFLPSFLAFQLCLFLVRIVDWLVFTARIKGRENLRAVQSAVIVSNHTLVIDPGVIAHVIRPRRTYFTMLEETALIPYLGTFVRLLGAMPIPPNSMRRLENAAIQAVEKTGFIHFFPEGECFLWNQEIRPFSPGAFFLACRLRLPVIPITTVLHERKLFGRRSFSVFGRVMRVPPRLTVIVGKPLHPEKFLNGNGKKQSHAPATGSLHPANGKESMRKASKNMGETARIQMQETIDHEGGCKALYRGMMPRLATQKAVQEPTRRGG